MTQTRGLLWTLLFGVFLTLLFWGPLWLGYGFVGGDLYPYFFPQKAFLSDRLHDGEFPLWNCLTGFGYPILGESQTGAAYPLHVIAYYLFDVNTAYNVEHLLHYVLCFVATWLFAQRVGMTGSGSFLMAFVFTYGWFPPRACLEWAIVTGAWLPIALWCVESFFQTGYWRYAIGLSLALGMQLLAGHFHLAFITVLLVSTYSFWRSGCWPVGNRPCDKAGDLHTSPSPTTARSTPLSPLLLAVTAGFMLAAVQLLPAWELKARSSRAVVGGEHEPSYGHLPPMYVSQLFAPFLWYSPIANADEGLLRDVAEFAAPWHWFGPHHDLESAMQQTKIGSIQAATNKIEAHLYCGLVPLGLALFWSVVSITSKAGAASSRNETLFWCAAALLALVFATGWLLPVARYLPGFNFFRGPGRYGIVTTWAIALLAGRGLNAILNRGQVIDRSQRVASSSRNLRVSNTSPPLSWGGRAVIGIVFYSTCGDLWLVSRMVTNVVMVSSPAISFRDQSPVRKFLTENSISPRVYCPGQNVGNLLGVSCLPVYLGIAPTEYADSRFTGKGMPKPADDGKPVVADDEFSTWLRGNGVTHVLSFHRLEAQSWHAELVWDGVDPMLHRAWGRRADESLYLYRLLNTQGLIGGSALPTTSDAIPKAISDFNRNANRVTFNVESPAGGTLILRDLAYPGWIPMVNDQAVTAASEGPFRRIGLPPGTHHVEWSYRPTSVRIGLAVSLATLVLLAGLGHLRFWHPHWLERLQRQRRPQ